jgi:hypothetical protein
MVSYRGVVRGLAVAVASVGFAALPSVVAAQNGPAEGSLTVEVVVTGDAGGDPSDVAFAVIRQSPSETVLDGTGQSTPQVFTLPAGSYLLEPSVADSAYTITDTSCVSQAGQGPNRPDFIIDGTGTGGGGDARCVITVTYTAPTPTDTTTTTTVPGDITTTTTTVPGPASTVAPDVSSTTAVGQGVLPPAGGGTPTGTMPVTGPTGETGALALTALGLLTLGGGALALARRH